MSVSVLLIPAVLCLVELCSICTDPGDYTSGGYSLSFSAGQTSAILFVSTVNDTVAECDEFFKVTITGSNLPEKVLIGDPNICFVTIQDDNDGEICLCFEMLIAQTWMCSGAFPRLSKLYRGSSEGG